MNKQRVRPATADSLPPVWRVLVVDDDPGTLQVTRMALNNLRFCNRSVELTLAPSAQAARRALAANPPFAMMLLDVVMETDTAGLDLVRHVRENLCDTMVRIAVRTGQPGLAPEVQVLQTYDVNDYREKTDLTVSRLRSTVIANLRAYQSLCALDHTQSRLVLLHRYTQAMQAASSLEELGRLTCTSLDELSEIEELSLLMFTGPLAMPPAPEAMWHAFCSRSDGVALAPDVAALLGCALRSGLMQSRSAVLEHQVLFLPLEVSADEHGVVVVRLSDLQGGTTATQLVSLFAHAYGQAWRNLHLSSELRRLARLPLELPFPLMRLNADGTLLFANDAATPVLRSWAIRVGDKAPECWRERIAAVMEGEPVYTFEEPVFNGAFELTLAAAPEPGNVNLYGRDITETRHVLARLHHAAFHDELTGLYNRAYFRRILDSMLDDVKRRQGSLGLLLIDLDGFKRINDTQGHGAGDEVLRAVARRLQDAVRHGDVVARLGGDEFAVLSPSAGGAEHLSHLADRLRAAVATSVAYAKVPTDLTVNASIGHTSYPADATSSDDLMRCADLAMYHAKREQAQGVSAYDGEVHRKVRRQSHIEHLLIQALRDDALEVHYQPIIDIRSGCVHSVEALARLRDDSGKWVSPSEFIAVAESSQLIGQLSEWVLAHALRDMQQLRRYSQELRLAFNASGCLLRDLSFVGRVTRLLAAADFAPSSLDLELTESMLIGDTQSVIGRLHQFKDMGIELSIDDFGTGYSSLSYLSALPVSKVKIDRSFVHEVTLRQDARTIVNAIVSLGHGLGLEVIAEGVEQITQLELLGDMGCKLAQGFHFSRPLPVAECAQWLAYQSALEPSHGRPH